MFNYGSMLYQLLISSYVIYPFFFSMHMHDQPENVNKHTTFCDVRNLLKDRPKPTKCKVMFLTSNKTEYR